MTLESPSASGGNEELSLVSTQMPRKVLLKNAAPAQPDPPGGRKGVARKDEGGGFDPYDTGQSQWHWPTRLVTH